MNTYNDLKIGDRYKFNNGSICTIKDIQLNYYGENLHCIVTNMGGKIDYNDELEDFKLFMQEQQAVKL